MAPTCLLHPVPGMFFRGRVGKTQNMSRRLLRGRVAFIRLALERQADPKTCKWLAVATKGAARASRTKEEDRENGTKRNGWPHPS